jgi:hypothetical protein
MPIPGFHVAFYPKQYIPRISRSADQQDTLEDPLVDRQVKDKRRRERRAERPEKRSDQREKYVHVCVYVRNRYIVFFGSIKGLDARVSLVEF